MRQSWQASREPALTRLCHRGSRSLCDSELVSVLLLPSCASEFAAQQAACKILEGPEGLAGLLRLDERIFLSQVGVSLRAAGAVLAAVELGRRMARIRIPERQLLDRLDLVASYLWLRYHQRDQELAGALYLDVRDRLIEIREIARGTLTRASVEPRIFLRPALEMGARSLVMFHTHPSGNPAPSAEDLTFTYQLDKASRIVGVELLDHLILGSSNRYVSLSARGALHREKQRILPDETQNPQTPVYQTGQEGHAAC